MKLSQLIADLQAALKEKGDVEVCIAEPTSVRHHHISVTYDRDPDEPVVIESYRLKGKS